MCSTGKILIMGVGGCGSSFLLGLLEAFGFETFGVNEFMKYGGVREAVKNGTLDSFRFPRVIKHQGGFMKSLNDHIDRHSWEIEHIFFSVASYEFQIGQYVRRRLERQKHLNMAERRLLAERDYKESLACGLIQLIERDHPFTMVRCPRSIKDSKYCYDQLKVVLGDIPYEEFKKIHASRIRGDLLERLEEWSK